MVHEASVKSDPMGQCSVKAAFKLSLGKPLAAKSWVCPARIPWEPSHTVPREFFYPPRLSIPIFLSRLSCSRCPAASPQSRFHSNHS